MEKGTASAIAYKGKVDVTLKKGKKTVAKKTYHNAGNWPLYEFLSDCIVSNTYRQTKAPRYLRLFTLDPDGATTDATIEGDTELASTAVYYSTGETVSDGENPPYAYLHFVIPASALSATSGSTGNTVAVYQAGLYSAQNASASSRAEYSAMVNFTKIDENGATVWDGMEISTVNGDYTIFVDWTLSFSTGA